MDNYGSDSSGNIADRPGIGAGEDSRAGGQGDEPADHAPEKDDDVMNIVTGVIDHPEFDFVAEDDEQSGGGERQQRDGDQQ